MRPPVAHVWRAAALVVLAALGATGCALGERPTLAEAPTGTGEMTGDAAIDSVLQRLDTVSSAVFTGEYSAVQMMGGATSTVRVAQSSPTRRTVTVGDVRYLVEGTSSQTCDVTTGACAPGLNAQRISNTGLQTPDVVFDGLAKRLRLDATANVGPTTASEETIGGERATCVDVPLANGSLVGAARYCALDNGVVAKYSGADFTLDLVSYAPMVDEGLFATSNTG